MGLGPKIATVFVGDSIGCEVPDPIFSQPLRESCEYAAFAERKATLKNRRMSADEPPDPKIQ